MTRAGRRKQKGRKLESAIRRDDPKALLREAVRLLKSGDYARAADFATRAGRVAIDDAWKEASRALVVEAKFRGAFAGTFDKRLSLLDEAILLDPGQPRLHFHRAIARIPFQLLDRAIEDLDAVAAAEPDRPGLALLRAFAAIGLSQPVSLTGLDDSERAMVEAVHGFANAGMAPSVTAEPWQTLTRLAAGRRVDPEVLAQFAEQSIPRVAGLFSFYEGIARIQRSQLDHARVAIARAMDLGFHSDRVTETALKLVRADIVALASAGEWVRAVGIVPQSGPTGDAILDETASVVLFHFGLDAARAGDWSAAKDAWSCANELCGSRALAQNLALAAEALGDWREAAEAWRQMIRRRPRSPKHPDALTDGQVAALWMHVADCHLRDDSMFDVGPAVACILKALKFAGNDAVLRLAAAKRLAELGEEIRALDELERIVDADPDNAEALEALGLVHLERWPRDAIPVFKRLVELEPKRPGARGALVAAYAQAVRGLFEFAPVDAKALAREGLELFPDEPELVFVNGRLRQEAGMESEAAEFYRRAILIPTERHDASAAAFHELLHLKSQAGNAHAMFEVLLIDPRSNAGFWLDQATSALECEVDEDWARRFLDEAIEKSEAAGSPMTRIATILAAFRIVIENEGSDALLSRYEQRATMEAPGSAALEAIRAVLAFRRNDRRGAASMLARARKLADRAGDSSLLREIAFLDTFCANRDVDPVFFEDMPIPPQLLLELMMRFPDGPPSDMRKIPKELMNELRRYLG